MVAADVFGVFFVPANLRKRVDFEKEVTLVGRANRMELWGREHWEEEMNQALDIEKKGLLFLSYGSPSSKDD